MEENGQEFPETTEEYLALYNHLEQNDFIGDADPIDPNSPEAEGLEIVDD